MIKKLKKELLDIKDRKYKDFSASLLPGVNNVIGVRLPVLRKKAKEIAQNCFEEFIKNNDYEFFELAMLEGMAIGNLSLEFDEILKYSESFIPKINNWAVCDSFCASLKAIKKNKEKTKKFLEKYFSSENEYEQRFCYVILLNYFIESDYEYVIEKIEKFSNENYYAKMAAAWCLSICFVKNFDKCFCDIKTKKIHPWVLNKGITKALESFRLKSFQKEKLKEYKTAFKLIKNNI